MTRTTKKTIHPKYQEFLDKACSHVSENTRNTYAARLRLFPTPTKLTIAWFRKRMQEISPHTAAQERLVIKMFKKWNGDNIEKWKELKLPKKKDSVTVEDLYTREELQSIFGACIETRDRALLQVLYESATRAGELLSMTFERVKLEDDGTATIIVSGKTGTRTTYLKDSVPALIAWMNVHPKKKGPLWTTFTNPIREITHAGLTTRIKGIMNNIELGRKPKKLIHMFRHTRITELVRLGIRGQTLHDLVGWTKASNMEAVYVHLSTEDVENEVRSKLWGEEIEPTQVKTILSSSKCPKCGTQVDENDLICTNCSFPLTSEGLVKSVEEKKDLETRISNLEKLLSNLLPQPESSPHDIDEEYEKLKKEHQQKKKR